MRSEILVEVVGDEARVIVLEDGIPVDLIIERETKKSLIGNIYKGRVETINRGLGAAFIDLGEQTTGFLPVDQDDYPVEGESVWVQVRRDGYKSKGPQVSCSLSLAGRFTVFSPYSGKNSVSKKIEDEAERTRILDILSNLVEGEEGVIARTASELEPKDDFSREIRCLREIWSVVRSRGEIAETPSLLHRESKLVVKAIRDYAGSEIDQITISPPTSFLEVKSWCEFFAPELVKKLVTHQGVASLFRQRGLHSLFDEVSEPLVPLPSGGALVIDQTEALTVIDVNSRGYSSGKSPKDNASRINLEAAVEICRQIRLRNIGGMIVIDFIGLDEEEMGLQRVTQVLEERLSQDKVSARLLGKTNAGLIEIIRRRTRPPISEFLREPCPACQGSGSSIQAASAIFNLIDEIKQTAEFGNPGQILIYVSQNISDHLEKLYQTGEKLASAIGVGRVLSWKVDNKLINGEYQISITTDT